MSSSQFDLRKSTAALDLSPRDQLLGKLAVVGNFVSEKQLKAAIKVQQAESPSPPLGELLLRMHFLSQSQHSRLKQLHTQASERQQAKSKDPWLGKTLGSCKIQAKIGQGGMGAVYKALDQALDRTVVIKIIPKELARNEEQAARFVREARAAARLEHPNIVQVYRIAKTEDGIPFIVMQFVAGGNLEQYVSRRVLLDPLEATRIIKASALGLKAAHAQGLVHRDIKPENILLGHDEEVKVADFGLAKQASAIDASLTAAGQIMGTPYFMAPEQWNAEPVDRRTDLYALGCTYFFALTGKRPFDGDTAAQLLNQHLNRPPPKVLDLQPNAPAATDDIIAKLMAKAPSDRYQDAASLIESLNRLLATDLGSAQEWNDQLTQSSAALVVEPTATPSSGFASSTSSVSVTFDSHSQTLAQILSAKKKAEEKDVQKKVHRGPKTQSQKTIEVGAILLGAMLMIVAWVGRTGQSETMNRTLKRMRTQITDYLESQEYIESEE